MKFRVTFAHYGEATVVVDERKDAVPKAARKSGLLERFPMTFLRSIASLTILEGGKKPGKASWVAKYVKELDSLIPD